MTSLRKLLTAGGLAAGVLTMSLATDTPTAFAQPPKKDKKDGPGPKDGPREGPREKDGPKHIADLRRAYDILAEVRPAPKKGGPREDDGRRLFDATKRLYRDAVKAAEGDGPPNPEQSAAAHDAARGLKCWMSAMQTPAPDLPKPPAPTAGPRGDDPWEPARGELRRAKDRLEGATAEGGPIGKEFLDAAKKAYADGRAAYEAKDYDRAADLARAAEAWGHVGEHLDRAADRKDGPDGKAPPPPPERPAGPDGKAPPPPPDRRPEAKAPAREAPPAPPPLGEKEPRERPPVPRP